MEMQEERRVERPHTLTLTGRERARLTGVNALRPGTTFELKGLDEASSQGDSEVAQIARPLGVETIYTGDGVTIKSSALKVLFSAPKWERFPYMRRS